MLCFSEVTYFQVKELLEQAKDTESGKKNFFGQYSSQNMKVKLTGCQSTRQGIGMLMVDVVDSGAIYTTAWAGPMGSLAGAGHRLVGLQQSAVWTRLESEV